MLDLSLALRPLLFVEQHKSALSCERVLCSYASSVSLLLSSPRTAKAHSFYELAKDGATHRTLYVCIWYV